MTSHVKVLRPNLFNAAVPLALKNLVFAAFITAIAYGVLAILKAINVFTIASLTPWLIGVFLVFLLAPLSATLFTLIFTKYYFYATHVVREFKFISVKRYSVPYRQIVNIKLEITIWDRITKAGDVTIFTAENNEPSIVLHYIRHPRKVEHFLHEARMKGTHGSNAYKPHSSQSYHARTSHHR